MILRSKQQCTKVSECSTRCSRLSFDSCVLQLCAVAEEDLEVGSSQYGQIQVMYSPISVDLTAFLVSVLREPETRASVETLLQHRFLADFIF